MTDFNVTFVFTMHSLMMLSSLIILKCYPRRRCPFTSRRKRQFHAIGRRRSHVRVATAVISISDKINTYDNITTLLRASKSLGGHGLRDAQFQNMSDNTRRLITKWNVSVITEAHVDDVIIYSQKRTQHRTYSVDGTLLLFI